MLDELLKAHKPEEAWFWATHAGAELGLLMVKQGKRIGVEIKHMDAPRLTPSMKIAMEELKLDELLVVYRGERPYSLAEKVKVVPFMEMLRP